MEKFGQLMDRLPAPDGRRAAAPTDVEPDALRGAFEFAQRVQQDSDGPDDWAALDENGKLLACGRSFRQAEFGMLLRAKLAEQAYKAETALEMNRIVRAVAALPKWAFQDAQAEADRALLEPQEPGMPLHVPSRGEYMLWSWQKRLRKPQLDEGFRGMTVALIAEYFQHLGEGVEAAERFVRSHPGWHEDLYQYYCQLRREGKYVD